MGQSEFGSDYITVTDEDGNQLELELIMSFEVDDRSYMAFFPADMSEDDPDYGYVILRVIEENGEEIFATKKDDSELEEAYETFMTLLLDDEEGE